ncbi:DEAD/DEAH box helicase [Dehalobacter sp. DCM]|uniref:ATP-dependent DNA helicase n=1 Tax=Dehalobacter sp. DCM TaxID=2907827 RepID=UPI003081598C|nr:DEAD/DEAH box helicase [Dehalobacter sp. DCM]
MQQILILSPVLSGAPEDMAPTVCLRWVKGRWPYYIPWKDIVTRSEANDNDLILFVYDRRKFVPVLKKYFTDDQRVTVIDINDCVSVFYPTASFDNLKELALFITHKQRRISSPLNEDVRLIWDIVKSCWQKGMACDLSLLARIAEFTQGTSCQPFIQELKKEIIHNYPDRPIRTSPASNSAWQNLFAAEQDDSDLIPDSPAWAVACFQKDGLLSQRIEGYENRTIQANMAKEIVVGLTGGQNVVIEAGTGTGKTLAYLIPALWYARKYEEKVIVATHTITLQEQLFNKDLPLLLKVLPFQFRTALLKGKGNYLCLKRMHHDNHLSEAASSNERLMLAGLHLWAGETLTGDFGELPNTQGFNYVLKFYGADNPLCKPTECSYMSRCWLYKARKTADRADVIVINHSLLLADIKTNNKILPEYSNLIIDEAHNIYQTALKQLGFELSLEQMSRLAESIYGGRVNLYNQIKKKRIGWAELFPSLNWSEFDRLLGQIPDCTSAAVEQTKELFGLFNSLLHNQPSLRLDAEKIGQDVFQLQCLSIENLIIRLHSLTDWLDKLITFLSFDSDQLEETRLEIIRIKNDIGLIMDGLITINNNPEQDRVTYLEKNQIIYLKNTLINVAPVLSKRIFSKNNCTVLTSATLSVAGDFSYLTRDIGMEDYMSVKLDSPFDYNRQMLLCVVKDLPVRLPEDQLAQRTASFILEIAEKINGGILVLFTSHRYLRRVSQIIEAQLNEDGSKLHVRAQGIHGAREDLLREFMDRKQSILLGTNSFWEGVDLPGDCLRCVIMVRLPFCPPDTPIMEAKARLLESQGRDPFYELNLPEAVIRFKQGFGRLIRTKNDRGVVIVLDDRIVNKRYGRFFLKALPISSFYQGSTDEVLARIFADDYLIFSPLT